MKNFKIYESLQNRTIPGQTLPIAFFTDLGFPPREALRLTDWWDRNRSRIRIHYFPFATEAPIMGVFFGEDVIAINQKPMVPPPIKIFIALHESKHADQFMEGRFEEYYFGRVVNRDLTGFLESYAELEREANDYAISSMRDLGFSNFIDPQENRLRGNEGAGRMVYNMMSQDIEKYKPETFTDLLISQII